MVSREKMSHSCWAVAGTLCGGAVQGTAAQKEKNCMLCDVYKRYNHTSGAEYHALTLACPDEMERYRSMMTARSKAKYGT